MRHVDRRHRVIGHDLDGLARRGAFERMPSQKRGQGHFSPLKSSMVSSAIDNLDDKPCHLFSAQIERVGTMSLFAGVEREYSYISSVARTFYRIRQVKPDSTRIITSIVAEQGDQNSQRHRHHFARPDYTYRELNEGANRYARWAQGTRHRQRGDVVALLMENRPEYLMAWLGMLKLGAIDGPDQHQSARPPLAHSISSSRRQPSDRGPELADTYGEIARADRQASPSPGATGAAAPGTEISTTRLRALRRHADPTSARGITCKDNAFHIFTSGTTGLPKAANISHHAHAVHDVRLFGRARSRKPSDRMYNVLPLYHSAGGICARGRRR